MVRSMIPQANFPTKFGVMQAEAYILDGTPSKSVPDTPYKLCTSVKPNLENLHSWGCLRHVHIIFHKHKKLGHRVKTCVIMKYPECSKVM